MKLQFYILFILIFISCKPNFEKKLETVPTQKDISLIDTLQLKLNHNKKWTVNPETHQGIRNIDSIIKKFKHNTAYKDLGEKLSQQTNYIITNCTMTGDAHNQLHVILLPILDEIDNLKIDNNPNKEQAFKRLQNLISKYFSHFELE